MALLIYVMSEKMYKEYTAGKRAITHNELINYINKSYGLTGDIVDIKIV